MLDQPIEPPVSSRIHSRAQALNLPELTRELGPSSTDLTEKSQWPGLRKAYKLSQIFSDFSFLDFTSRKSVEDLRAPRRRPKTVLIRPATLHGHAHETSLGGCSTLNFDTEQSRPTSSASTLSSIDPPIDAIVMPISEVKPPLGKTPQSSVIFGTSPTPQTKPSIPPTPESIPLPPSRPGSLRCSTIVRRRRKSLIFNQSEDDDSATECQAPYSRSLSNIPIPKLPQPKITPSFPTPFPDPPRNTRDSSPEVARQHFVEVKRARKMTQLFGQELPPELIQVVDDRWKAERSRSRTDSTASSTFDSVPATPACEGCTGILEGESTMPMSSPTGPGVDFQERRRRVAKLSQFFGVNHAEIASSIVFAKPEHHRATSSDYSQKPVSFASGEPSEVGIKVVSRRRFGLGEDMRDVELSDAINKLRCLKAN